MNQEIRIREAKPTDLEYVLHHRRQMFYDMGHQDAGELDAMVATSRPYFAQGLAHGSYRAWMAEDRNCSVVAGGGIVIMPWPSHPRDPQPRRAMILNVFTEPEYRRLGLARRLMVTMLDWLRQEKFGTVSLHASEYGRSLYESLGFEATNEMRMSLK
jgi:ribosomal protein S18 acetylase RimI-like enzyme